MQSKLTALVLSTLMVLTACAPKTEMGSVDSSPNASVAPEETAQGEMQAIRLQDDFYDAVNAQWMAENEIPANKASIGGFNDLSDEVEDQLIADLNKMLQTNEGNQNGQIEQMLKYYQMALDFERLDQEGAAPIRADLAKIKAISSVSELNSNLLEFTYAGLSVPVGLGVMADMKDTQKNALYITAPGLGLMDKSYYDPDNETGQQLMTVYEQMIAQLMVLAGETEEEAAVIAKDTIAFDKLYAPFTLSAEESSEFAKLYNPVSSEAFSNYSKNLDLLDYTSKLLGETPSEVVLMAPQYYEHIDEFVNEQTLPLVKNWMQAKLVEAASSYLSDDFRQASAALTMAMTGQTELTQRNKTAFRLATNSFYQVLGDYYGKNYFGEEAKNDVTGMVVKMIEVYKTRLENNDWLGDATKAQAIEKLETMAIQIGYPKAVADFYSEMNVAPYEEGGSFYSNAIAFSVIIFKDNLSKFNKPVDRDEWQMSAATVNAQYSPLTNTIIFPAAILQAPFCDVKQSASQNYGGIGAVIAHEISHAFDTNGSKYDEFGNMKDWWTQEDYKAFEEKTQAMIDQFDQEEYLGTTVNGKLTISENVADAGGLSCALEVTKGLPDADLDAFFKSWATIWRMKANSEYMQLLLTIDVHAPNKLRTNVQAANLDDFYETFDIKEGDGMYRAPENRIQIW